MRHPAKPYINPNFGARLRAAREERELSQQGLAKLLGRVKKTISFWERGLSSPSEKDYQAICRVFGKPADYFTRPKAAALPPSVRDPQALEVLLAWGRLTDEQKLKVLALIQGKPNKN